VKKKNKHAADMGRAGGQMRARNLTARQRSDSARKAAEARWAEEKSRPPGKRND
jgi:hypothetical protein